MARYINDKEVLAAALEMFTYETRNHQLTVLHDDGLYRHLRFMPEKSRSHWFDLVTWPGRLCFTGDRQSHVFSRLDDMFEFFRSDHSINPGYWSEKLVSDPNVTRYNEQVCRQYITEVAAEAEEDYPGLSAEVQRELLDDWSGVDMQDEWDIRQAVNRFSFLPEGRDWKKDKPFQFTDTWEWDLHTWDFHFIWACYAIHWGIKQYDSRPRAEEAPAPAPEEKV